MRERKLLMFGGALMFFGSGASGSDIRELARDLKLASARVAQCIVKNGRVREFGDVEERSRNGGRGDAVDECNVIRLEISAMHHEI